MKKRIRFSVVWAICSPFFFLNMAIWFWLIFCLPSQQEIQKNIKRNSFEVNKLVRENQELKRKYRDLWHEAHFLAGENLALNRSFDKISKVSLQLAIEESQPNDGNRTVHQ